MNIENLDDYSPVRKNYVQIFVFSSVFVHDKLRINYAWFSPIDFINKYLIG